MKIELRDDSVLIDGYVNAVERDSRPLFDEKGERFVERIMPNTFQRAIEKTDNIKCLLDHDEDRVLGSTKDGSVELYEDNVGLRAICSITDSEVIEKTRDNKLRGWSFGFQLLKGREEDAGEGLKRRFVDDINLFEVSIIDNRKMPAYIGTSIETRAEGECAVQYRAVDVNPKIVDLKPLQTPNVNYTLSAYLKDISDVGDTIYVKHPKCKIDLVTSVIALEYNVISERFTKVEFGNFKSNLGSLLKTVNARMMLAVAKSAVDTTAKLQTQLTAATNQIKGTLGNSYVVYDGDKILVVDTLLKEYATNVIIINNGGIGFSQSGINGTFKSAWTIDGTLKLDSALNESGIMELYDGSNTTYLQN